jgi:hypothetical protein
MDGMTYMPENERPYFDGEDWEPWDCDNDAEGESDLADRMSETEE